MVNPIERATKDSFYMIEFRYGEKDNYSYHRITDWTSDVTLFGEPTYSSVQALEITPGKRTGDLTEGRLTLKVQRGEEGSFFHTLSSGEPHSRTKIVVRQMFQSSGLSEGIYIFRGWVKKIVRNADGRNDLVRLECVTFKDHLELPLGMGANPRCGFTYGDKGCGLTPTEETGTITAISGSTVTITGLNSHIDSFWHRGYIKKDGIRLTIRGWSGTTFQLSRQPPISWLNEDVTVVEGCDKKVKTCRDDKLNESRFVGIGKGIPAYHPMFENPK